MEFPVVFLCGVNQGNLPLEAQGRMQSIEEERRLFYVGLTRAEDTLILLHHGTPSLFLEEIPKEHLNMCRLPETLFVPKVKQISLF